MTGQPDNVLTLLAVDIFIPLAAAAMIIPHHAVG